jgi:hypothetical protein
VTAEAAGINLSTSFSSKSELSLNLSTDGTAVTFMGYDSAINQLDVSNSNTPADVSNSNSTRRVQLEHAGRRRSAVTLDLDD